MIYAEHTVIRGINLTEPTCVVLSKHLCFVNVLSSIPVTTCILENTFSTVRRLKTYLRNSCGQNQIIRLALMSVHRQANFNNKNYKVVFCKEK